MAFINQITSDLDSLEQRVTSDAVTNSNLRFLPKELTLKCRQLIESYHSIHGSGRLPDMIWHSEARDVIECHDELMQVFRKASKARGAKRAHEAFLLIATAVMSLEVLARDFAGWGRRFPAAKHQAEALLVDLSSTQRSWFMDQYLFPSMQREFAKTLAPVAAGPMLVRNAELEMPPLSGPRHSLA
jgi:hypothetical protein